MEAIAHLKLIKPAHTGDEIKHGDDLLLLQIVEALIALSLVSSKVTLVPWRFLWSIQMTNISILTMMLDWPDDTFVKPLPAPAFTDAVIFSLSFLMVLNVDSGRLGAFLMVAIDSPPSYLLKMPIFCSKVIDFSAFFLPGASLALRSRFGAMMHKRSLHTMLTITAQNTIRG